MAIQAAIGVDVGGTNIKAGVVDGSGHVAHRRSIETQAEGGFEHVFQRLLDLIRELHALAGVRNSTDVAIGIGVPGPMSHAEGLIYGAPNLPGWVNIPLRKMLRDATGLAVTLENDAKAAAFGEFTAGAGRGVSDLVLLTLGTGIGGGVIVDGRVHRGGFDNAGEVGHMLVVLAGRACPCGQHGCLERYSSANAIWERLVEAVQAGEPSALAETVRAGREITSADVQAAAAAGDKLAARIWDEACRYLALACVNLQHVLNPKRIIFSGGLIRAGEALFEPVRRHFAEFNWKVARDQPEILPATLAGDAGVIGAAALAFCEAR